MYHHIVDTKLIDSYLGCYVIFPDTVQLPAPVEVDPQAKDHDEAGKPPQGQEPIEAGKEEQKQGNPKKFVLTQTLWRCSFIISYNNMRYYWSYFY